MVYIPHFGFYVQLQAHLPPVPTQGFPNAPAAHMQSTKRGIGDPQNIQQPQEMDLSVSAIGVDEPVQLTVRKPDEVSSSRNLVSSPNGKIQFKEYYNSFKN